MRTVGNSITQYALVYVARLNVRTRQIERDNEPVGIVGPHTHKSDAVCAAKALFKFGPTETPDLQPLYADARRKLITYTTHGKMSFLQAWRKLHGRD